MRIRTAHFPAVKTLEDFKGALKVVDPSALRGGLSLTCRLMRHRCDDGWREAPRRWGVTTVLHRGLEAA